METQLNEKVKNAISLLRKGEALAVKMQPELGYFLAFSGGKDSQVLMDIVKKAGVKYRAFYSVTGNDAPENVYFIRKNYPEVEFIHPKEKYIKIIEKSGMPTILRRKCCERLKERVGKGCVVLTGVRAEESRKRAKYEEVMISSRRKEHEGKNAGRNEKWLEEVVHDCIKGQDRVLIHPLLSFTSSDIWKYIDKNKIPHNPLYEKCGRVGCMFCPFASKDQLNYYEKTYPKFKDSIIRALEKNIEKRKESVFKTGNELYEWWKSKESIEKYMNNR